MSILIKNMVMPKNCGECPFIGLGYDQLVCRLQDCVLCDKAKTTCPLIELPPHGDLIDRDALMKDGWLSLHKEVMRMGGYAIHELPLINPTIPVVIEKEN